MSEGDETPAIKLKNTTPIQMVEIVEEEFPDTQRTININIEDEKS